MHNRRRGEKRKKGFRSSGNMLRPGTLVLCTVEDCRFKMRRRHWLITGMKSGYDRPSGSLGALLTKIYVCRVFLCLTTEPFRWVLSPSPPALGCEGPSPVSSLPRFVSERTSPLYFFCLRPLWNESAPVHQPSRRSRCSPCALGWLAGGGWCYAALCCYGYCCLFCLFLA